MDCVRRGRAGHAQHQGWTRSLKVVAFLASAFVLISTTGAYALLRYYTGSLHRLDVFGAQHQNKSEKGAVNYLLVGTDSGQGLSAKQLSEFHLGARRDQL